MSKQTGGPVQVGLFGCRLAVAAHNLADLVGEEGVEVDILAALKDGDFNTTTRR